MFKKLMMVLLALTLVSSVFVSPLTVLAQDENSTVVDHVEGEEGFDFTESFGIDSYMEAAGEDVGIEMSAISREELPNMDSYVGVEMEEEAMLSSLSTWTPSIPLPNRQLTTSEVTAWSNHYCQNGGILPIEREILELVNAERQNRGLQTLQANYDLFRAARFKSQEMVDLKYFAHTSPVYGDFWIIPGLFTNIFVNGENIAMGSSSAQQIFNMWMNSEGHRNNILNPNTKSIGIGFVGGYATQIFSTSVETGTACFLRTVAVTGGTGGGSFETGTIVSIRATVPSGQRFVRWEGPVSVKFANANSANTTFVMPSSNVTVRAIFEHQITEMVKTGVTRRDTSFRRGPGMDYAEIRVVNGSTNVRITGRSGVWYRVVVGDTTGWIRESAVAQTHQHAVVATNNAHVRAGRGTNYRSLTRVSRGERVTVDRRSANWSRITVNGRTGWIHNRDLHFENAMRPGRTTANNVRVHTRPNADSTIRHRLPRHTQLMIVQRTTDGWTQVRIRHNGGTLHGWVRTNQIETRTYSRRLVQNGALRSGPGSNFSRIRTVNRNTSVTVRSRVGKWYHVQFNVNGRRQSGWLHQNNLPTLRLP